MKLDIGSGDTRIGPDFTTVDRYSQADITADMRSLPFDVSSVDEIWCSHALEHIGFRDAAKVLEEFYRVLKPDGTLTLTVPDFDYVARYWLRGYDESDQTSKEYREDPGWAEMMVFGNQAHEGEYHKSAWSREKVKFSLLQVGFRISLLDRIWDHEQKCIRAVSHKR